LKKLFIFIVLFLATVGCSHSLKPDSDISKEWISQPLPNDQEVVSAQEAHGFIDDFFKLLNIVIFDPTYRKSEIEKIKAQLLAEVAPQGMKRGELVKSINGKFKEIHFSHLAVLNPEKTEKIMNMSGVQETGPTAKSVSAKMVGDVGVIKVASFLVPSITLEQVKEARKQVENAKYLIYDMRDNGGGSVSSNSYLIENIIGPNQTIQFSKTRKGLNLASPIVKHGFFPDEKNNGSDADIAFENEHNFVEWKTRQEIGKDSRPTAIVVNQHCGSSCDVFSIAIKESQSAPILGTNTAGAVLGAIAFKLRWKGYTAIMPVSQIISPKGVLYEGVGVAPDVELKTCADEANVECLTSAISWLKKKKPSSRK
jgi:hypothetical protein